MRLPRSRTRERIRLLFIAGLLFGISQWLWHHANQSDSEQENSSRTRGNSNSISYEIHKFTSSEVLADGQKNILSAESLIQQDSDDDMTIHKLQKPHLRQIFPDRSSTEVFADSGTWSADRRFLSLRGNVELIEYTVDNKIISQKTHSLDLQLRE